MSARDGDWLRSTTIPQTIHQISLFLGFYILLDPKQALCAHTAPTYSVTSKKIPSPTPPAPQPRLERALRVLVPPQSSEVMSLENPRVARAACLSLGRTPWSKLKAGMFGVRSLSYYCSIVIYKTV